MEIKGSNVFNFNIIFRGNDMMQVGIVTIISKNYGNRLQNYVLQRVLEALGYKVKTIPMKETNYLLCAVKTRLKVILSRFIVRYKNALWDLFDLNIHWNKFPFDKYDIDKEFDFFIAGSDQIWNPLFECNSDREFLVFTTDKKKIAYAASIGLNELPDNEIVRYRRYINSFKAVSVREKSAADIIEKLDCDRPKVVLDPTMLLLKEDWKTVINRSKLRVKEKYVVMYFLGMRTKEYVSYIRQKSAEMHFKLIDIAEFSSDSRIEVGPVEFVSLLYHSEAVFTDSFHGTVFSILFHKPFIVFERPYEKGYGKMSSRLDTLLETFDLNEHRITCKEQLKTITLKYDFSSVDEILREKRKDSIQFLKEALHN